MKQAENKVKVKEKIEDLNRQILELKNQVTEDSVKDSLNSLILELEKTRDVIQKKYDAAEAAGDSDWTKLEKNIYTDLQSFNQAYKKAGALFKPRSK